METFSASSSHLTWSGRSYLVLKTLRISSMHRMRIWTLKSEILSSQIMLIYADQNFQYIFSGVIQFVGHIFGNDMYSLNNDWHAIANKVCSQFVLISNATVSPT